MVFSLIRQLVDELRGLSEPLKPSPSARAEEKSEVKPLGNPGPHLARLKKRFHFAVVDGSSRRFGSPHFRVFIAGVAVYGLSGGAVRVYPVNPPFEYPFIAIKAQRDTLRKLEGKFREVRTRSLSGKYYDELDEDDISDEVRMALETDVLSWVRGREVVILDGPIYIGIYEKKDLANYRLKAVEELTEGGSIVVGVVKRVDVSKRLCRGGVLEYLGVGLEESTCNDAAVVSQIGKSLKAAFRDVYLIGPFEDRPKASGRLDDYIFPERVFWYVYSRMGPGVFRIETLKKVFEERPGDVENVANFIASSIDSNGLPYMVDVADSYARKITSGLYIALYELMMQNNISPIYESLIEYRTALQDYGRGVS